MGSLTEFERRRNPIATRWAKDPLRGYTRPNAVGSEPRAPRSGMPAHRGYPRPRRGASATASSRSGPGATASSWSRATGNCTPASACTSCPASGTSVAAAPRSDVFRSCAEGILERPLDEASGDPPGPAAPFRTIQRRSPARSRRQAPGGRRRCRPSPCRRSSRDASIRTPREG